MSVEAAVWLLLVTAIILANIPWLFSTRLFLFIEVGVKKFWVNLAEWFLYFVLMGFFSYMLEMKVMGHVKEQQWEFYVVTLFMFMIFSFPGVIYRYNIRHFFKKTQKPTLQTNTEK